MPCGTVPESPEVSSWSCKAFFFNKLGLRFLPAKRGSDHAGKDGKRCKKNVINGDTEREGGNGWIIGKTFEYWVTTGFRANLDY